jgi:hypothetical protein
MVWARPCNRACMSGSPPCMSGYLALQVEDADLAPIYHGPVANTVLGSRPITLAEAATRVNVLHKGALLVVTTVGPPLRPVGPPGHSPCVTVLVEDAAGDRVLAHVRACRNHTHTARVQHRACALP